MKMVVIVAIAAGLTAACTTPVSSPPDGISLPCTDPIGIVAATSPNTGVLDAVALDVTSTLGASDSGGTSRHRLFAKTGLLVHVGREATLTVPAAWASRVSIAWGNQAAVWTTTLRIPACQALGAGPNQWLAFPGGYTLDKPACVPLEIQAGNQTRTVHVSVGLRCPA